MNAQPKRLPRIDEPDLSPDERHPSRVIREPPRQHVHQRRYPRPVLPDQRVHFPAAHVEVNGIQRADIAKLLADAGHLKERVFRHV
jgi:hypothetical protein